MSAVRTWAESSTDLRLSSYEIAARADPDLPPPAAVDEFGGWPAMVRAIEFWS